MFSAFSANEELKSSYMSRLPIFRITVLFLLVSGLSIHPFAQASQRHMRKYKAPPPMATVQVTVLRAEDNSPLQNVGVVFHATSDGKDQGNMELKTNREGKASLNIIPIGSKVLVQVIASGYRTFGNEYDIPTSEKQITIKMVPPGEQYSVYEKNPSKSDVQTNTPQTQMGHAEPADSPLLTPPEKKH
jgi:hypothetical protein